MPLAKSKMLMLMRFRSLRPSFTIMPFSLTTSYRALRRLTDAHVIISTYHLISHSIIYI